MLPSPSEPPEVSQPTAQNNEKAPAQNEAAIALKGTMRDFRTEMILSQVR